MKFIECLIKSCIKFLFRALKILGLQLKVLILKYVDSVVPLVEKCKNDVTMVTTIFDTCSEHNTSATCTSSSTVCLANVYSFNYISCMRMEHVEIMIVYGNYSCSTWKCERLLHAYISSYFYVNLRWARSSHRDR